MPILVREDKPIGAHSVPETTAYGDALARSHGRDPDHGRAPGSESSRGIAAPETAAYGDPPTRSHGRDDFNIWSRNYPIGAREVNHAPIGAREMNHAPIGAREVNHAPIGAREMSHVPFGAREMSHAPFGARESSRRPFFDPFEATEIPSNQSTSSMMSTGAYGESPYVQARDRAELSGRREPAGGYAPRPPRSPGYPGFGADAESRRSPETPLPQFSIATEVLRRGMDSFLPQTKSELSSLESYFQPDFEPDDDDDDDEPRESFKTICSKKAVNADGLILDDIYDRYIAASETEADEEGVTLMLRDIPYRLQVEPDLLDIIRQTCEVKHVEYIYLPMTIEGFSARSNVQSRNKGYCFIHFSVAATAHKFSAGILEYAVPDTPVGKTMFTAPAKFQGLTLNLINLLDIESKKWRPKNGLAHIRTSSGELACVGLLPLRNLVKHRVRLGRWPEGKAGGPQSVLSSGPANHLLVS
jgi:hypothetical protein